MKKNTFSLLLFMIVLVFSCYEIGLTEEIDTDAGTEEFIKGLQIGDFSSAKAYYKKSCDENVTDSCFRLAAILAQEDKELAKKYYRIACRGFHDAACGQLGRRSDNGDDIDLARSQLQSKCSGGDGNSCFVLGALEYDKKEWERAVDAFTVACEADDWKSCFSLAGSYAKLKDKESALKSLNKSCKGGYVEACGGEMHYILKE